MDLWDNFKNSTNELMKIGDVFKSKSSTGQVLTRESTEKTLVEDYEFLANEKKEILNDLCELFYKASAWYRIITKNNDGTVESINNVAVYEVKEELKSKLKTSIYTLSKEWKDYEGEWIIIEGENQFFNSNKVIGTQNNIEVQRLNTEGNVSKFEEWFRLVTSSSLMNYEKIVGGMDGYDGLINKQKERRNYDVILIKEALTDFLIPNNK